MSKQTNLTLSEKVDLNKINRQPTGTSHHRLAKLLSVPNPTIERLFCFFAAFFFNNTFMRYAKGTTVAVS